MFGYKRLMCPSGHAFSAFVYSASSHVVCPQCKALNKEAARNGSGVAIPYDFSASSLLDNNGNSMFAAYNHEALDSRQAPDALDSEPPSRRKN